jgi:hypothetical protein
MFFVGVGVHDGHDTAAIDHKNSSASIGSVDHATVKVNGQNLVGNKN